MRFSTDYIKRIGKKAKSKRGTTLIEMVATLAILSIVATLSLQAMVIAHEEYLRVKNVSSSQRSVSLMQENLNKYIKNAIEVQFINVSDDIDTVGDFETALNNYKTLRASTDPFLDFDYDSSDVYNDYVLYRSGTFRYTLSKYSKADNKFIPVFNVDNIKEINFSFKALMGTYNGTTSSCDYEIDYVITSPTSKESIFTQGSVHSTYAPDYNKPWDYKTEFKQAIKDNFTKGDYSIVTGTVLNNMYGSYSTTSSLRISEGLTNDVSLPTYDPVKDNDGSFRNFLFIRILPKVAV